MYRLINKPLKTNAVAYIQFCDEHGIDPIKLLAASLTRSNFTNFTAKEFTEYMLTDSAIEAMEATIKDNIPSLDQNEIERFFATAWPFNDQHLFAKRFRVKDLGTFGDFQELVSGKRSRINSVSRELAIEMISKAISTLPEQEREKYFPFHFIRGSNRSYEQFRSHLADKITLPSDEIISNANYLGLDVNTLNSLVSRNLGIEAVAIPSVDDICKDVRLWMQSRNMPLGQLHLNNVQDLIDQDVVKAHWIHHRSGLFKSNRDFIETVRASDGIKRLPIAYRISDLSRGDIIELLNIHCPRLIDGKVQKPVDSYLLAELSADRRIPAFTELIGNGRYFSSIRELQKAIGYKFVEIPMRNWRETDDSVKIKAHEAIETLIKDMLNDGVLPINGNCFTRDDFLRAQELGFTEHGARIIGKQSWFPNQKSFEEQMSHLFPDYVQHTLKDAALEILKVHWPIRIHGVLRNPIQGDDVVSISQTSQLPSKSVLLGNGKLFPSLRDLHLAMGYPRIHIAPRKAMYGEKAGTKADAVKDIGKVIKTMLEEGIKPSSDLGFTIEDFKKARKLGIVDQPYRIIGSFGWFSNQKDLFKCFEKEYKRNHVKISNDKQHVLDVLSKRWPVYRKAHLDKPPTLDDLVELANSKRIPQPQEIIGESKMFTDLAEIHSLLGYPLISLEHGSIASLEQNIIRVIYEMNSFMLSPVSGFDYGYEDLMKAQELGILKSAEGIIGSNGIFASDSEFAQNFKPYFYSAYSRPVVDGLLSSAEKAELECKTFNDLADRCEAEGLTPAKLNEGHIKQWCSDGSCPTLADLDFHFGGFNAVRTVLSMSFIPCESELSLV